MSKQKTYINIGGQIVDASSVKSPNDRQFRDAWAYNGSVIEIDLEKAKAIRIEQLIQEADQAAAAAEHEEKVAALTGNATKLAEAKAKKERYAGTPAAVAKLRTAKSAADLVSIKLDDIFSASPK